MRDEGHRLVLLFGLLLFQYAIIIRNAMKTSWPPYLYVPQHLIHLFSLQKMYTSSFMKAYLSFSNDDNSS